MIYFTHKYIQCRNSSKINTVNQAIYNSQKQKLNEKAFLFILYQYSEKGQMQFMLATAMLANSHIAYTYGLLCTGSFYQQLCGHKKDSKAVWCVCQGRLYSVLLFTGTFKHYGKKKVPHLPLDIQSEIKLNSSAVTRLSWGTHNISQQLKAFWYWQTDNASSSRG